MIVAEHLVARARFGVRTLLLPAHACWLWARLREHLSDALSVVFMPDHVHVVARPGCRDRFVRVLSAFTGLFRVRFDVLDPQPAVSKDIAMRMIRYGLRNPVKERLVTDPFAWRYSTLRDLVGAAHPIWTPAQDVAAALSIRTDRLVEKLTVTADQRPAPVLRDVAIAASLPALRAAVVSALRIADEDAPRVRRLIVQAAHAIEMPGVARLARELACSERTIGRARAARDPALPAVLVCLGDPRLRSDVVLPEPDTDPDGPHTWSPLRRT